MGDQKGRRLVELAEVGGHEDQVHAPQRPRAGHVDRDDPRVRVRGAKAGRVEHTAGLEVIEE